MVQINLSTEVMDEIYRAVGVSKSSDARVSELIALLLIDAQPSSRDANLIVDKFADELFAKRLLSYGKRLKYDAKQQRYIENGHTLRLEDHIRQIDFKHAMSQTSENTVKDELVKIETRLSSIESENSKAHLRFENMLQTFTISLRKLSADILRRIVMMGSSSTKIDDVIEDVTENYNTNLIMTGVDEYSKQTVKTQRRLEKQTKMKKKGYYNE